jgi:hypothetical protein
MSVEIRHLTRTPFDVKAVQVTSENIHEVAAWCGGEVLESPRDLYIKLTIPDAKSSVRTSAFPGDWILLSEQGYRVYTEKAKNANFTEKVDLEKKENPAVTSETRRRNIAKIVYNAVIAHDSHLNNRASNRISRIVDDTVDAILKTG